MPKYPIALLVFLGFLTGAASAGVPTVNVSASSGIAQAIQPKANATTAQAMRTAPGVKGYFEKNAGQIQDRTVRYLVKKNGYNLYFRRDRLLVDLFPPLRADGEEEGKSSRSQHKQFQIRHLGASNRSQLLAGRANPGRVNYLVGKQAQWKKNIPTFASLRQQNVYPGIDLVYRFNNDDLEYDYEIQQGASPEQIKFLIEGADRLALDKAGNLRIAAGNVELVHNTPLVYQEVDNRRVEVKGRFVLANNVVSFKLEDYDKSKTLVIDPVINFSSYLGDTGFDNARAIVIDENTANVVTDDEYVIVGATTSSNFPSLNASQANIATTCKKLVDKNDDNFDIFITKMKRDGTLVFSTFLGGGCNDGARGVALDSVGDIYITGLSSSSDFPTTSNAIAPAWKEGWTTEGDPQPDAIVVKINGDEADTIYSQGAVEFSTYLGGTNADRGRRIAVDSAFNIYVGGNTASLDFSQVTGCPGTTAIVAQVQCTHNGPVDIPKSDVFLVVINGNANAPTFSYGTFFGGSNDDFLNGMAIRENAGVVSVYLAGTTTSADIPSVNGAYAFAPYNAGPGVCSRSGSVEFNDIHPCMDVFLAKLDNDAKTLSLSTYFGGEYDDELADIAVDVDSNVYLVGTTVSNGVLLTSGDNPAYTQENADIHKRFPLFRRVEVTRSDPNAIHYDGLGDTRSREAFVSKFNPTVNKLIFSTFLRGSDRDVGTSIDVARIPLDPNVAATKYEIYVTGHTSSLDFFPLAHSARSKPFNEDIFLTKLVQLKGTLEEADATLCRFPSPGATETPQAGCPVDDGQVYSILLGGEDSDFSYGIAAAKTNNTAVVTGYSPYVTMIGGTFSDDYPVTATAIPGGGAKHAGQIDDAFVTTLEHSAFTGTTDLEVSFASGVTKTLRTGSLITYSLEIKKLSGVTATNTRLGLIYPVSVTVESIPSNCSKNGLLIYCNTGDLDGTTSSAQVAVTFRSRYATNVTLHAIASSAIPDSDLGNNSAATVFTVTEPPNRGSLSAWALAALTIFVLIASTRRVARSRAALV